MALVAGSKPTSWKGSFARPTQDFSFLRGGGVSGGGASKEFNENRPLGRRGKTEDEFLAEQRKNVEKGKNLSEMSLTEVLNSDLEIGVGTWTAPVLDSSAILPELIEADRLTVNSIKAEYINAKTLSAISADLGTITAGTITGATIQTDAAANTGVKIDSNGITGYDSTNTETFSIDATTGNISITQVIGGGTVDIVGNVAIVDQATAGEDITEDDAVVIAQTSETLEYASKTLHPISMNLQNDKSSSLGSIAGSFTITPLTINQITIRIAKVGSPTDNLVVQLQINNSGAPSGSPDQVTPLASASIAGSSVPGTEAEVSFDVGDVQISSGTYWIVIYRDGATDATNYYQIGYDNVGTGGALTWSGSGWVTSGIGASATLFYRVEQVVTAGNLYRSTALKTSLSDPFVGIALNTATSGNTVQFQADGIWETTGLTPGDIYYLSNTAGAISTTPGSNSVTVGKAISTTKLKVEII